MMNNVKQQGYQYWGSKQFTYEEESRFLKQFVKHVKEKAILIFNYSKEKAIEINRFNISHQRDEALKLLNFYRLSEEEEHYLVQLVKSLDEALQNGVSNYSNPNIPHDTDFQSSEKE